MFLSVECSFIRGESALQTFALPLTYVPQNHTPLSETDSVNDCFAKFQMCHKNSKRDKVKSKAIPITDRGDL
jgi:hypothetical protein